ncbi:actin maturation protease [Achroia grisella]|uniref:actin maturation protease n=1 Tax=Achroia grisella TaxID=688607 RepID=UPI0027D21911|nr:actin maturation protease [Achroia grisella]
MCTIPPAPPPPPPAPFCPEVQSPSKSPSNPKPDTSTSKLKYLDVCEWATNRPELWEACAKHDVCHYQAPFYYKYTEFPSILQVGPTCGLVALSMIINNEVTPEEMLNIAKMEGYTNNGEMFSCKNMIELTKKVFNLAEINVRFSLQCGGLFSKMTIERLLNGAALLVPYDADFNHSPCLKRGHKAHWALVCGIIIVNDPGENFDDIDNVYVLCKHGKSRYLAAWKLYDLEMSNKNLFEFSPQREGDGLMYILPEGGVGGENGLQDQFLMFEGF